MNLNKRNSYNGTHFINIGKLQIKFSNWQNINKSKYRYILDIPF